MIGRTDSILDPKKRYLQIALNGTLSDAHQIINHLPRNERIIIEAGTPLIKKYGEEGIKKIRMWYEQHLIGNLNAQSVPSEIYTADLNFISVINKIKEQAEKNSWQINKIETQPEEIRPYVVADMKMMDRGQTEVEIAARAGASAVIALGASPIESLDTFIEACEYYGIDSMIDMMNIEFPLNVLRKLKKIPQVVILHRGVDEEKLNKEKQLPLHEIRRIKSNFDIMISIAGGDEIREVQRAIFNDADIVVIWKSFYQSSKDTAHLAEQFLNEIK